jgi:hypothetical protein
MGWPYVQYIHAREIYPKGTVSGHFTKTIDAFDPAWVKAYDAACRRRCTPHRDNPNLVGYYTDNEPFWSQPRRPKPKDKKAKRDRSPFRLGRDVSGGATLLQVFMALPPDRPGHEAAWSFALKRHGGTIVQLARDWGADFKTREQLRRQTEEKSLLLSSVAYGRDHDDFTRLYADTYFRVTGEAIRRHDPNHMVLGIRHCSHWTTYGQVVLESYARNRRHVDVFSMNTYHYDMHEAVSGYARFLDRPIIIGEASWGSWLDYKWGPPERYPDEIGWLRTEAVRQTARMIMHPAVVGYTWYKWYLGETPDRPAYGVVTNSGVVNRVNAGMLRRLNPVLEDVHAGTTAPEMI